MVLNYKKNTFTSFSPVLRQDGSHWFSLQPLYQVYHTHTQTDTQINYRQINDRQITDRRIKDRQNNDRQINDRLKKPKKMTENTTRQKYNLDRNTDRQKYGQTQIQIDRNKDRHRYRQTEIRIDI